MRIIRRQTSADLYEGARSAAPATQKAPQARFAWQAPHLEHLRLVLHGRQSIWSTFIEVAGSLATSDANGRRLVLCGRHLEHLRLVLRGHLELSMSCCLSRWVSSQLKPMVCSSVSSQTCRELTRWVLKSG